MKTGAEPKLGPTESSNSQESKTSCAGSVPSMKAQELASPLSYELGVDDIDSIAKLTVPQWAADAIYPTPEDSSRSFQDDATLQPENLDANRSHAAAPEDAAQTKILLSDRKRPYVGTGLFRPELPREAPGASLHQAEEDYVIKCICGFYDDDGSTVFCDGCDTWQHTDCYYFDFREFEDIEHLCVECNPREFDIDVARDRQLIRRASQHQVSGNKRRKTSPRKAPRRSPGVLSTNKEPAKISLSHEGPLAEVSGTTDPTSEVIYAPTTHRTRKAKKGMKVHVCSKPGCGKVCCRSPRFGHTT